MNELVAAGYAVTASDYQGEGTPGLMPYIVGASAAEDTVMIVEAARSLPGVSLSPDYVVWGHSEGGQTAMFSIYDHKYAPHLNLRGVVAGAPPSQFSLLYNFLVTSPFDYYLLMVAGSYNSYYGSKKAPLSAIMTTAAAGADPATQQRLLQLCQGVVDAAVAATPDQTFADLIPKNPFTVKKWAKLFTANDPASFKKKTKTPLLIIQGGDDEQIPVISTQILQSQLCKIGQPTERWVYSGQSHAGVIEPSFDDMLHWIGDRFTDHVDGRPLRSDGGRRRHRHHPNDLRLTAPPAERRSFPGTASSGVGGRNLDERHEVALGIDEGSFACPAVDCLDLGSRQPSTLDAGHGVVQVGHGHGHQRLSGSARVPRRGRASPRRRPSTSPRHRSRRCPVVLPGVPRTRAGQPRGRR